MSCDAEELLNASLACAHPFGDLRDSYECYEGVKATAPEFSQFSGWSDFCTSLPARCNSGQCWCAREPGKCGLAFALLILFLLFWVVVAARACCLTANRGSRSVYALLPLSAEENGTAPFASVDSNLLSTQVPDPEHVSFTEEVHCSSEIELR